ncbi:MAG TPA: tetratricopeptide repeat protein [Kofleriaceae bacterium]|nr:tetratricopeptide repeat protein [Kofleriaceae bacterium]
MQRVVVILGLVAVTFVAACPVPVPIPIKKGTDRKKLERHNLGIITPAPLEATSPWKGEPRSMKVRVQVDEDFRAQTMRWKQQIDEQFDDANQFLVPALGIRLDVVAYEHWPTRSASKTVPELLTELHTQDAGDDVQWVVGYVSSLSIVSATFESLGAADLLGKHAVIRGYAENGERKWLDDNFPRVTKAERERAHDARRRHKQTTILIHELAHSLGALHESDAGWIMFPQYSVTATTLSDQSRELMQIALEEKLKATADQDMSRLAGRLVAYFDANPWGGWDEEEKQELGVTLRQIMDSGSPTGSGHDVSVPAAAYDQMQRAQRLAAQGKPDEALAELEALVAAYPSTAEIRQAICEVQIGAKGPGSEQATAACTRASEITPDDPRPYVARVEAYVRAGDQKSAMPLLAEVEKRAGERAPVWDRVAEIYQATGRISQAEAAARRSMAISKAPSHPLIEWSSRTRARYGLPPDAKRWKIAPADEGDYIAAVRELLDLIYAGKIPEAQAKARAAEKRWRNAPGILGARCDLHLRQGDTAAAKKLCAQAIAGWSGAAWAHYLEGVIALQEHKDARAEKSLRAAVTADPELGQAYRALGKALSRQKKDADWSALAATYQQKFGQALPR